MLRGAASVRIDRMYLRRLPAAFLTGVLVKVLRPIPALFAVCLFASWTASAQPPQTTATPTAAAAPTVDAASLREILLRVGEHQFRPVEDGDYKRGTWEEVQANRKPTGVIWTYQWGVTQYGLLRATDATGDTRFADFVAKHNEVASRYASYLRWYDATFAGAHKEDVDKGLQASGISRFIRLNRLDFCGAMGHSMLESILKHGEKPTAEETEILDYVADYISKKQGRIPGEDILFRPEDRNTLWIDDLYMSCPFLIRRAKQANQPSLLDDAAKQYVGFAKRQQDTDGLWFHAAFVNDNRRTAYKWSRANGWTLVTAVEILSVLPEKHPLRPQMLEIFKKHIAAVKKLQRPSGLWPQVIDHPELWDETSSSAMFSYAIARGVRRGWLPKEDLEVAKKAMAGVMKNVAPNGDVLEVSEGTGIGETVEFYRDRRRPVNDHHGPGPVMFAAAELLEIENEAGKKSKR
jgi:unsaturated rhamnogalacturonyl hydrolase